MYVAILFFQFSLKYISWIDPNNISVFIYLVFKIDTTHMCVCVCVCVCVCGVYLNKYKRPLEYKDSKTVAGLNFSKYDKHLIRLEKFLYLFIVVYFLICFCRFSYIDCACPYMVCICPYMRCRFPYMVCICPYMRCRFPYMVCRLFSSADL